MARRRTVWTAGTVALVTPLLLAGCGAGAGQSTDDSADTLRILDSHTSEPNAGIWRAAIDACAEPLGVEIEQEAVPGDTLISKVLQQASSKTLPDVLMLDNPDLQEIAATGALAPLSDFGVEPAGISDGILAASTYEGEVYALQPVTNTLALFYNKTLFAEAGLEPPTTWDELKETALAFADGDRYGLAMSNTNSYEGTWQFLPFMWSNGGDEADIATPETAAALQLLKDLQDSGAMSKSTVTWGQGDAADQFAAGNAAMMVNGPWNFGSLDQVEGLDYGIVPIPVPSAGDTPIGPFGGEVWAVPQTGNAEKQQKAAELVACLASDEQQVALATGTGTVPTNPDLADQVVASNPKLEIFADMVPNLRARTGELGTEWPKAATKIYTAVQNTLVQNVAPEAALEAAQNG
ncbi:extracellular solute-binding protein [Microbacterium sp. PRC9]|uniref:sugar ABC transporter substrate-binding protein n=1 Tax=Microbacterium sp. PRC9 TaxID=2962591 RepID=UPI002882A31F|nr:extracellular solute-binding protein [Microbacterium sp. PRC9]MDT0144824.1 extracellular solute-binding protein [Microbacterium sp. PRC9]